MKVGTKASHNFLEGVEVLFHKYKDVFAWNYQDINEGYQVFHLQTSNRIGKGSHIVLTTTILNEFHLSQQGAGRFGSTFKCQVHCPSKVNQVVIPHCHCTQKEWEIMHLCGL